MRKIGQIPSRKAMEMVPSLRSRMMMIMMMMIKKKKNMKDMVGPPLEITQVGPGMVMQRIMLGGWVGGDIFFYFPAEK